MACSMQGIQSFASCPLPPLPPSSPCNSPLTEIDVIPEVCSFKVFAHAFIRYGLRVGDLLINSHLTIPESELSVSTSRSSGPGGQHVNKTESKIELRWNPGLSTALAAADRNRLISRLGSRLTKSNDLIVVCSSTRSQHRNREMARERLAELVRAALIPPKWRIRTRPGRKAIRRRLEKKKRRSQRKRDRNWRPSD